MLQKTTLEFCSKIKFSNILGQYMVPVVTEFLKTSSRRNNQNILDLDSYVGKRNDLFLISIFLMCQNQESKNYYFYFLHIQMVFFIPSHTNKMVELQNHTC